MNIRPVLLLIGSFLGFSQDRLFSSRGWYFEDVMFSIQCMNFGGPSIICEGNLVGRIISASVGFELRVGLWGDAALHAVDRPVSMIM